MPRATRSLLVVALLTAAVASRPVDRTGTYPQYALSRQGAHVGAVLAKMGKPK